MQAAADTLDVWKQTYKSDFEPANALALLDNRLGRYDRGAEEAREALARTPRTPVRRSRTSPTPVAALGPRRGGEAGRRAGRGARRRHRPDAAPAVPARRVLEGDAAAAQRQLDWAAGKPREFDLVAAQAQVAAYLGRLRARERALPHDARARATATGCPKPGCPTSRTTRSRTRSTASAPRRSAQAREALSRAGTGDAADALPRLRLADRARAARRAGGRAARARGGRAPAAVDARRLRAAADDARRDRARARAAGAGDRGAAHGRRLRDGHRRRADPRLPARARAAAARREPARARGVRRASRSTAASTRSLRSCALARLGVARALARERRAASVRRRRTARSSTAGRAPTPTCRCCSRHARRPPGSPARSTEAYADAMRSGACQPRRG